MNTSELIYDWNQMDAARLRPSGPVLLNDETLRDGLQSPSVRDPAIAEKIQILHLMEALGINSLDLGLPGAGPRALADCEALAREIARQLRLRDLGGVVVNYSAEARQKGVIFHTTVTIGYNDSFSTKPATCTSAASAEALRAPSRPTIRPAMKSANTVPTAAASNTIESVASLSA